MPYKNNEIRKAYHKRYGKKWERENKRWTKTWYRERRKSWRSPERNSANARKALYGITHEEYKSKCKQQKNRCALCGQKECRVHYRTGKRQSLSVDHNHETGQIRELLCRDCNLGLGMFQHCPNLLLKAIKYLKKHKRKSNGRA